MKCNSSTNLIRRLADGDGLPAVEYKGQLPFSASTRSGEPVKLPEDPWFLLGNFQTTCFVHVSGMLQLLTGARAWGRLNQGPDVNTGRYRSQLTLNDGSSFVPLTGMEAPRNPQDPHGDRTFGTGYARFSYALPGALQAVRTLAVPPSPAPGEGSAGILLRATFHNRGEETCTLRFQEAVGACFLTGEFQNLPPDRHPVRYSAQTGEHPEASLAQAWFEAEADDPLLIPSREAPCRYEGFPPGLYVAANPSGSRREKLRVFVEPGSVPELVVEGSASLPPGESVCFEWVLGVSERRGKDLQSEAAELTRSARPAGESGTISAFGPLWKEQLPLFPDESDRELAQEMTWHAYCLHAMANDNEFDGTAYIPQGMTYTYQEGIPGGERDHLQHTLPLCTIDPPLARSALLHALQKVTPTGDIMIAELGHGRYTKTLNSDPQLYLFMALAEYLRATGDDSFLSVTTSYFPASAEARGTVLDHLEQAFIFLRDEIGCGVHDLVRLLFADWNDGIYFYFKDRSFPDLLGRAESHLNSALAVSVLEDLTRELDRAGPALPRETQRVQAARLSESMKKFSDRVYEALDRDWSGRDFLKRVYMDEGLDLGADRLFLEPQVFALQMSRVSPERKNRLWTAIRERVVREEPGMARQQETPQDAPPFAIGNRENGGCWYALQGPLVLGLLEVDREAALEMLERMTLRHRIKTFPDYWAGQWSGPDNYESSLRDEVGLPDQLAHWSEFGHYCAHAHAWPLYAYLRSREFPTETLAGATIQVWPNE